MARTQGRKAERQNSEDRALHAEERQAAIVELLRARGFITFRELESEIEASPATLRRDLAHLSNAGHLERVHGGARIPGDGGVVAGLSHALQGVPFRENVNLRAVEKRAIGRAAAELCSVGDGIIIDGGSTTLQMCPHLGGRNLQVLTNSLHIVSALLPLLDVRVLVPGGTVFREQNIILSAAGDDVMPRFHAPKLFMGACSVGPQGILQPDVILVAAERRLIEKSEAVILLVDSSKFGGASGHVVCGLDEVDVVVSDQGISRAACRMLEAAGVRLVIADARSLSP